jgi:ketosteroid isomerase-like protein
MPTTTRNLALVKGILERMVRSRDFRPLVDALTDDVVFTLLTLDGGYDVDQGKTPIFDYLEPLGELVTFWRVRYYWSGARVVVLAEERFTIQPCGLAAHSRFDLLFDLRDGRITRFGIVEHPRVARDGHLRHRLHASNSTSGNRSVARWSSAAASPFNSRSKNATDKVSMKPWARCASMVPGRPSRWVSGDRSGRSEKFGWNVPGTGTR